MGHYGTTSTLWQSWTIPLNEDHFQDIDEDIDMSSLISRTMVIVYQCSVKEYVNGDNFVSVCVDIDDEQWDQNVLDSTTEEDDPVTGGKDEEISMCCHLSQTTQL